jgi:hypothetical protein
MGFTKVRFFASVVDPLQSRVVLPYTVSQMFFTTSWPFVIGNLLLISFYWYDYKTYIVIGNIADWC